VAGRREPARIAGTDNLDSVQRVHIEGVLEQCGWRISGIGNAADRLGVHPNTLRFRMKKLGMACPARVSRTHQATRTRPVDAGQGVN
jgi:transcriptional regulator with GAF, ATPase, and Fis domain